VVNVAGQHHLACFDPTVGGDDRRAWPVDDVQDFGVFEDQRAQAVGRARLAQAQVERVQVQVAQVLQRAQVQRALQVPGDTVAVEQLHLVAHAAAFGFGLEVAQLLHVRRFHRRMQMAALEVAVDAITLDPLLDDLVPAPAQVPDEIIDFGAQVVAHLCSHGLVTGQAAGDLAAVATAGPPANPVGLDDRHLQAALGQLHRSGHARETTTDDRHVDLHRALELRVLGVVVQRGAVIGRCTLGWASVQYCVHGCSLF